MTPAHNDPAFHCEVGKGWTDGEQCKAYAITSQQWRTIIVAVSGEEWGTNDEDARTLARELREAGFLVQRIGNVVRIVKERICV